MSPPLQTDHREDPGSPRPPRDDDPAFLSDREMVFASEQATPPATRPKKMTLKSSRARLKLRKSTLASSLKGNGRKRLVNSPLSEDKQLCKRIDFGEGNGCSADAPRCKMEIFPANASQGGETPPPACEGEDSGEFEHGGLAIVCYTSPATNTLPMEAGHDAGEAKDVGHEESSWHSHPWSKFDDNPNSNLVLGESVVNLSENSIETKLLSESSLEACHMEESRDSLTVGTHVQPTSENLLLLAQPDVAESLDRMAAQPLLAGAVEFRSAGDLPPSMAITPAIKHKDALNSPYIAIDYMPVSQPTSTHPRTAEGFQDAEPQRGQMPNVAYQMDELLTTFGAPLDEFPPLERGRTLKIRDKFESSPSHNRRHAVWPRTTAAGQASRDKGVARPRQGRRP